MSEIFVLVEHRQGKIRDITYEILGLGENLANQKEASSTAILLGHDVKSFAEELAVRASKVLVVEDENLKNLIPSIIRKSSPSLNSKYQPFLILMGHTAFGMDLAPSLSVEMDFP